MDVVVSQIFTGLSIGSILLLAAIGLALTFGQMGVINMAHGEFIMAGGYTAFVVQGLFENAGVGLLLSIPVAFLVGGLLGVILEMTLLRRMYHRPLDTLLVTYGVSLILQQLAKTIFGTQGKSVETPTWLQGPIELFGFDFPKTRVFVLVLAVVTVVGLSMLLKATSLGRRIRATVQNRQLAECSGISTRSTDRLTFFVGSGLAGIAGVALTQLAPVNASVGQAYIINAFLVVVVGGIGQIKGAVIAAFVLGIGQAALEKIYDASLARILIFVAIVLFLQLRPQGIFNVRTRSLA
ncbi:urea ABC transporter permease subunit UrtB [Nakamurella leprariae]|uniref:Urea ABC transporter permease subunit UrtB n=1 Tax=Nakamurella leprariae TaxID=2803911 RepID=A0A939C2X7_9ACTN|nr:urea ABC transporter permease subunit UrtB [Nakamurella leprariae]MBM9468774.1 urea ABC transporter permease subunit UrtB [Nakamurella leprariae]